MTFQLIVTSPLIFTVSTCKPILSVYKPTHHLTTVFVTLGQPPGIPVIGTDREMTSDRNFHAEVKPGNKQIGPACKNHLALVLRKHRRNRFRLRYQCQTGGGGRIVRKMLLHVVDSRIHPHANPCGITQPRHVFIDDMTP